MKLWLGAVAIAVGFTLSSSTHAADYYFASTNEAGWFFVDLENVETVEGSVKSAWTLTIHNKTEERGSAYRRNRGWFNCEKRWYIPLEFYDYRLDGKVRDNGRYSVHRIDVRPGSVLESQLDLVCTTTPNPAARLGDVVPLKLTELFREKAKADKEKQ